MGRYIKSIESPYRRWAHGRAQKVQVPATLSSSTRVLAYGARILTCIRIFG